MLFLFVIGQFYFSKHQIFLLIIISFCVVNSGLKLEEYRKKIGLDVYFNKFLESDLLSTPMKDILSEITTEIMGEYNITNSLKNPTVEQMQNILYRYIITRKPEPIHVEFLSKINFVLQQEVLKKQITNEEDIPVSLRVNDKDIKIWKGDITVLSVDSIVNAANNRLLGCWIPGHRCIDNVIHANAGPQVRDDCNTIMTLQGHLEPTGIAKITRAYNLPSKYILHTVGPIWDQTADLSKKKQFELELALSYTNCLNLTSKIPNIFSIAFCCVSTGEFGFPQELAAQIAFKTVLEWCQINNENTDLKSIVFNVFLERDNVLYRSLIKEYKMRNT